jgi:hypothetical protein
MRRGLAGPIRGRFVGSVRGDWFAVSHKAQGSWSQGFTKKPAPLVPRVSHIERYNLSSSTCAVAVVNCQFVAADAGRQAIGLQRRC